MMDTPRDPSLSATMKIVQERTGEVSMLLQVAASTRTAPVSVSTQAMTSSSRHSRSFRQPCPGEPLPPCIYSFRKVPSSTYDTQLQPILAAHRPCSYMTHTQRISVLA